jgi:hypothetical protein
MPPQLDLSSITLGAWTAVPVAAPKEDRWGGTTKLWNVVGPDKGLSLWRFWPKSWGFRTGVSHTVRLKKGNKWVGHIQVASAYREGGEFWVVSKSHLDEAYRGTGLGSLMYLAARNMIEAYKFEPIKMISTKDYGGSGTSPMAQKVWDRLRGEGRLALKVVHQGSGREGQNRHLTRRSTGTLPTSLLLGLKGARGEHRLFERSRTGAQEATRWRKFVESVRREGVRRPVFVVVEWTDDLSPAMRRKLAGEPLEEVEAFVYEGNHRIRAAQEAGLAEVPVEVNYFGHAERHKGLLGGKGRRAQNSSFERDLASANVFLMDWVCDGWGKLPAKIQRIADKKGALTAAEKRALVQWFRDTAPGNYS